MSDEYKGIEELDLGTQDDGEAAVVEEPELEPKPTKPEAEEAKPEEGEQPTEEEAKPPETKPKKPGSQRAREQRDHERTLRIQAEEKVRELEAKASGTVHVDPGKPKLEDFDDLASWEKALTEYAKKLAKEEIQSQIVANKNKEALDKTSVVGRAKYEDFDDDIEAVRQAPLVSVVVAEALTESSQAADLIHHFAEHPDELNRISQLSPVKAAREIVALEAKYLAPPTPKPTSKAPPPVRPVSGGTNIVLDTKYGGIEEF